MGDAHNLLVISDLHLGEDLSGTEGVRKDHATQTEQALSAFLDHYAKSRIDGRPWDLVVNGDMIDFLSVKLSPEEIGVEGTDDERTYGFGATEPAARAKLARVLQRHAGFFRSLGGFLAAGNRAHLVIGNHDAEFHWPSVQADLRAALDREAGASVGDRIDVHPWFWFEPDLAWVEHGHQYDVYCSFEDPLTPEDPNAPGNLEENLGTAAMRYLGNHLPVDPDATADLSFFEYLHLIANAKHDATMRFFGGYVAVARALGTQWLARLREPERFAARKERRKARMKEIASAANLRVATLERLHRLRRPPVFVDLLRWIRSIMLGRLLLTVFALALAPYLIGLSPLIGWVPAVVFTAVVVALHLWMAWGRENVDPSDEMRKVAERIRALVHTPVVTFGHSHVPLAHQIGRSGWYFNSGAWAGGSERPNAFTHLVVVRESGRVRASLCRWRGGESRELRAETTRVERQVRPAA